MRAKSIFVCQDCGHQTPRWHGRCPGCGEWNVMIEEWPAEALPAGLRSSGRQRSRHRSWLAGDASGPRLIREIGSEEAARLATGFGELDRVLGGGLVKGSLVLIGGDPGIGKSTLLLQVAGHIAAAAPVLYVTGEESAQQIAMRGSRLGVNGDRLYVLPETDLKVIEEQVRADTPALTVIDSIQTVFHPELASAPGSVAQVRECATHLLRLAKTTGTVIALVGHVTKGGDIAGPRTLEHVTDTVLYFEGQHHGAHRLVRSVKNRFGATHELGLFQMKDSGLAEVPNPSAVFLAERPEGAAGSVVVAGVEGTRPLLVEVQALVSPSPFPHPRRTASGVPTSRIDLVLAVLERRVGLGIMGHDVYLKVSGGLRLDEPAADLGIALALASSLTDRPADPSWVVFGEVGLAGELRSVTRAEDRIREAARMGFAACVLPQATLRGITIGGSKMELVGAATLRDAVDKVLQTAMR
ncbi:MAG: DNA repair protein RadA [Thermaerobacterales bacterium]